VSGLRDHERRTNPHDARRLAKDHLDPARVLVAFGDLERALRRLDLVETDDTAFRLRDRLLGEHDDVPVLDLDALRDERREVVAARDFGQADDRDDAELVAQRPVRRTPACAL
jgi:hypothetical protein